MDSRSILLRSALIAMVAPLQGCWQPPPGWGGGGTSEATVTQQSRIWFIEPADGATVSSPFNVKLGVSGFSVRPAGPGNDSSSGHHHVIVDAASIPEGESIPFDPAGATPHFIHWGMGQTEAMVNLPLGRHTLTAQFADGNHISYGPLVAAQITVTVVVGTANVDNASLRVLSGPTTMQSGQVQPVLIEATNIGSTTWLPGTYSLSLTRAQPATLPSITAAIPASVPPGGVVTLTYLVGCNGNGLGSSSAQIGGPSGLFGQRTGRTINCVAP